MPSTVRSATPTSIRKPRVMPGQRSTPTARYCPALKNKTPTRRQTHWRSQRWHFGQLQQHDVLLRHRLNSKPRILYMRALQTQQKLPTPRGASRKNQTTNLQHRRLRKQVLHLAPPARLPRPEIAHAQLDQRHPAQHERKEGARRRDRVARHVQNSQRRELLQPQRATQKIIVSFPHGKGSGSDWVGGGRWRTSTSSEGMVRP